MMKAACVFVAFATLLLACDGLPPSPRDVLRSYKKWKKFRPDEYAFLFKTECEDGGSECSKGLIPGLEQGKFRLSVLGKKIVKVDPLKVFGKKTDFDFPSVDGIFKSLLRLAKGSHGDIDFDADFDKETGFPNWVTLTRSGEKPRVYQHTFVSSKVQRLKKLMKAKATWKAVKTSEYKFRFLRTCFACGLKAGGVISVKDGKVIAFAEENNVGISKTLPITMEELFKEIEDTIERNPDILDVEYDPNTGVPVRCKHDQNYGLLDDEASFTVELL